MRPCRSVGVADGAGSPTLKQVPPVIRERDAWLLGLRVVFVFMFLAGRDTRRGRPRGNEPVAVVGGLCGRKP
jgi:hypothetical protein